MTGDPQSTYPRSYYAATRASGPAAPPLDRDSDAEVCIIGGGYSGLSAALRLAEHKVSAVLLEAGPLGWGASGRNGGQVHVGMRREQAWLEQHVGRDAAAQYWRIAIDGRDHLDTLMRDYAIDCDYRPGHLHADHKPRYIPDTRANVALLNDRYGYDQIRFVERDEVRSLVAGGDYHGGSIDQRGGHLHALNLALGIARAAVAAGASIHADSCATAIEPAGSGWRVRTATGSVTAPTVLLACGGYLRGLDQAVDTKVMPINNYIAVTEPLGEERASAIIGDGLAVSDSRFVVYYFRMTPDHRLLFGGGENYSYRFPDDIGGFVRPHLSRIFPQLADIPFDYAWGGTLSITASRLPFIRQVRRGVYNVSGLSGLGVVLAPYFGRVVADAIAGDSPDFDRLTRLPVPGLPGGRLLRWPSMVAAMSYFALRDRL
ncbi:MAG: FAD-binding oxidoreductase [Sphingomicrobium sp.]